MQQISPNAKIHPTAIIGPNVTIEGDVEIGPYCLIGLPAEKKGATEDKGVDIKQGAKLFGHCTIDSGTERATTIGEDVWLMKGAHVGHDAIIGANCVLSCHCAIGGHVVLSENCNIALNSSVHQYLELPEGTRSEEHTSELQSRLHLVCRLLLEKKKKKDNNKQKKKKHTKHDNTM